MAKKGKKTKDAQWSLPKRVAGVKVPKALRKSRFGALLASPVGIKLLTDAVEAGVGMALVKGAKKGSPVRSFVEHPVTSTRLAGYTAADLAAGFTRKVKGEAGDLKHDTVDATGALGHAFAEAARAFAAALHQPEPDAPVGAALAGVSPPPEPKAFADSGEEHPAKKSSARATDDARPH